ncbi:hypothetical protein OSL60_26260, partial [Escherichia coli]|nr:hypothetical protein [Escherichia coli]
LRKNKNPFPKLPDTPNCIIPNPHRIVQFPFHAALTRTPPISDYGKLKATPQRRSRCGREKPFICLCAARKQING